MPTLVAAAFLLALLPQTPPDRVGGGQSLVRPASRVVDGRSARVVLPRNGVRTPAGSARAAAGGSPQDPASQRSSDDAFLRDVKDLRRSLFVPESKELAIVQRIGRDHDRIPERCLSLARTSDPDVVHGLMRVLQTYGQPEHAQELEFLLLTRPFRTATEIVVDTMATIARDDAAERLFACLTASRSTVRHHAADVLAGLVRPEDASRLILLSQQASVDVQIKVLRLLGAVPPTAEVRARLIAALSQEPRLAESAVEALIQHGPEPAVDLQELLRRPVRGRDAGYAALVLASLEDLNPGMVLVTEDMAEHLIAELDVPDPFQQGAVAIALAGLAWRSDDPTGERFGDRQIIDALLEIVAPTQFVSHLSMLGKLAHPRLTLLAGRDLGAAHGPWRDWWSEVRAGDFVGSRRHVVLTAENAVAARLTFVRPARTVVLHGERARESSVELDGGAARGDQELLRFVVGADVLEALVADLERIGFMGEVPRGRSHGDADPRSLSLAVAGVVARSNPLTGSQVFDRFGARIDAVVDANRWQLYRDPQREPDAVAFWRAESRWLAQHEDPAERATRYKDRILTLLPTLTGARAERALEDLIGIPGLQELLNEADGLKLAEAAGAATEWDASTFRILELALLAPGDKVWPELLEVARARDEAAGSGGVALQRIFALAGPDRVLDALDAESPLVRRVAMDEIAALEDIRAVPNLLAAALDDAQRPDLRRAAVFALGKLRADQVRQPLVAMLDDPLLEPSLRRTTWISLARIGGEDVFAVLQKAFPSPDPADRRAIVQALGAMRHPRAAKELANIYALRGNDALGALALDELRQMGDLLASPALMDHLQERNEEVRRQCAMLLGEFQNPAALGELFVMLGEDEARLRVISLIAGITGQNVTNRDDRVEHLRNWYGQNSRQSQGDWLILALNESGVANSLQREQVQTNAGVAAVPELTRIVIEGEQPWLRSLAGRVLRITTGEDYGTISGLAPERQRIGICERYRFLHDSTQAAAGR